ncbi:MAG: V-type ATPase subunit [Candidatus Omnitrophica bacterium]|nr:V-type ATPase subunit [Candidatus Omnitrophota bacterium]
MSDFNYLNARIRSSKKMLLSQTDFEQLLGSDSITQIKNWLLDSPRGADVQEGIAVHEGFEGLESGLSKHMERTYRKLLDWAGDDAQALIQAILRRWDVHNLKTLIRGKYAGVREEELLSACMPACDFTWDELAELARQPTVRDLVNLLLTWNTSLKRPILKHQEFIASGQREALTALEFALDNYYYELGITHAEELAADAEPVIYLLNMEADIANILTVLRLLAIEDREKIKSFLINGGHLGLGTIHGLIYAPTRGDVLEKLRLSYLGRAVSKLEMAQPEISNIEKVFRAVVNDFALKSGKDDPLSIGVAINFIWRKQTEFTNLRLIIKSKTFGFSRNQVEQELVHG